MNTNAGYESRSRTRVCCELKNAYLELWAFIAHYTLCVICFKIELFSFKKKTEKKKKKRYCSLEEFVSVVISDGAVIP